MNANELTLYYSSVLTVVAMTTCFLLDAICVPIRLCLESGYSDFVFQPRLTIALVVLTRN